MDPVQETIRTYDATADEYAKNTAHLHQIRTFEKFISLIPKKSTVLDLGCGPGRDTIHFLNKSLDAFGIDLSKKMLLHSRTTTHKPVFSRMDMRMLGFKNRSFDAVWASASLLNIPKKDILKTLKEIRRISRPDAVIHISLKEGKKEGLEQDKRYGNRKKYNSYYTVSEITGIIERSGMSIIHIWKERSTDRYNNHTFINIYAKA